MVVQEANKQEGYVVCLSLFVVSRSENLDLCSCARAPLCLAKQCGEHCHARVQANASVCCTSGEVAETSKTNESKTERKAMA